jgi:hypothetical protein
MNAKFGRVDLYVTLFQLHSLYGVDGKWWLYKDLERSSCGVFHSLLYQHFTRDAKQYIGKIQSCDIDVGLSRCNAVWAS